AWAGAKPQRAMASARGAGELMREALARITRNGPPFARQSSTLRVQPLIFRPEHQPKFLTNRAKSWGRWMPVPSFPVGAFLKNHSRDDRRTHRPPAGARRSLLLLINSREVEVPDLHTPAAYRRRQVVVVGSHRPVADRHMRRKADSSRTLADSKYKVRDSHNADTAVSNSRTSQPVLQCSGGH